MLWRLTSSPSVIIGWVTNFALAFAHATPWIDHWALPEDRFEAESPRCRICGSVARADIDRMIVTGWEHEKISQLFNAILRNESWLSPQKVSLHARNHVRASDTPTGDFIASARDAATEFGAPHDEASEAAQPDSATVPKAGDTQLNTARAYLLDLLVAAGTAGIEVGLIVPEARDVLRAFELLEPHRHDQARLQAFAQILKDNLPTHP